MTVNLTSAPMDVGATTKRVVATYTGPASYPAGGDPVDPDIVRMGKVFGIGGTTAVTAAGVLYHLVLSGPPGATQTIRWYVATTGAEVGTGVDVSGASGQVEFIGQ